MITDVLEIRRGLPDAAARYAAAKLYWAGFSRKMEPVLGGRQPVELVAKALVPEKVIGAWDGDRLLGVAFVMDGPQPVLHMSAVDFVHEFGAVAGWWRRLLATFAASSPPADGALMLDTLAVSPAARGMGVGTALLNAVVAEARSRGLREVHLEVVDTNPRARALYERFGFVPAGTVRTPYLRRLMGYGAVTAMRFDVSWPTPAERE
ncbi:GNAT family N-acetyltransferase [Actinomadura hibisca]|uniref:GNAT family N-acetyltransferase n=1 Tax=Actinomadura hibisca TaxID=68565 RepID=UPI0008363B65|nr:GNAT family N-acetyltransferase [Actinomadura hibisca]